MIKDVKAKLKYVVLCNTLCKCKLYRQEKYFVYIIL